MAISTAGLATCNVDTTYRDTAGDPGAGELSIYLDNLATTPTDPRVVARHAAITLKTRGNPNSGEHAAGQLADDVLRTSGAAVGQFIGRKAEDTHFMPSASSALWTAVQDAINRGGSRRIRILASAIEHPSLLKHLMDADRQGRATLTLFPVTGDGQPDLDALRRLVRERADLICLMAANNEIGTITPVAEALAIAREHGSRTLVDASQAAGRFPTAHELSDADQVVMNGSKMYGPRGIGVLAGGLSRQTSEGLHALFGTPDVAAAAAMATACELRADEMAADETRLRAQRDALEAFLIDNVPGLVVNGDRSNRLAGALHVSAPDAPGEAVVARLWGQVDVSTGAACQSGVPGPSHVLSAMGVPEWVSEGAVRMCVGKFNDDEEIAKAGNLIAAAMRAVAAAHARRRA